jgi:hypothetical protein
MHTHIAVAIVVAVVAAVVHVWRRADIRATVIALIGMCCVMLHCVFLSVSRIRKKIRTWT